MTTGHDIAMGLRAAYLLMHRQTNAFLSPFGMTADQFVILALLSEKDGITQQEVTRRASSDPNTIRAMLMRMERNGLIERIQHPNDGRARKVMLTLKGRKIYAKLSMEIRPLQDALLNPFHAKNDRTLIKFLNHISEAMVQWEQKHQNIRTE